MLQSIRAACNVRSLVAAAAILIASPALAYDLRPENCNLMATASPSTPTPIPTTISISNTSTKPIKLAWLNYSGVPVAYHTIEPMRGVAMGSFAGHVWQLTDVNGVCLTGFTAASVPGVINYRDGLIAKHACNLEMRSPDNAQRTVIFFLNLSGEDLKVYWVNFQGQRVPMGNLRGENPQWLELNTSTEHVFVVTRLDDTCVGVYRAVDGNSAVID